MSGLIVFMERAFAPLAVAFAALAYLVPGWFATLEPGLGILLGIVMFSLGAGIEMDEFLLGIRRRRGLLLAVALQYTLMPLAAAGISAALGLHRDMAGGLMLLGSSPAGTDSVIICYLAGADLALSVSITLVTTLLAPLVTPLLISIASGRWMDMSFWMEEKIILLYVLVPLLAGLAFRRFLSDAAGKASPYLPTIAICAVLLRIAAVVAANRPQLGQLNLTVAAAVIAFNLCGYAAGYGIARLAGLRTGERRAVSLEVGMRNSGVEVNLAMSYLSPVVALPGVFFSLWQHLSGLALANVWRHMPAGDSDSGKPGNSDQAGA